MEASQEWMMQFECSPHLLELIDSLPRDSQRAIAGSNSAHFEPSGLISKEKYLCVNAFMRKLMDVLRGREGVGAEQFTIIGSQESLAKIKEARRVQMCLPGPKH